MTNYFEKIETSFGKEKYVDILKEIVLTIKNEEIQKEFFSLESFKFFFKLCFIEKKLTTKEGLFAFRILSNTLSGNLEIKKSFFNNFFFPLFLEQKEKDFLNFFENYFPEKNQQRQSYLAFNMILKNLFSREIIGRNFFFEISDSTKENIFRNLRDLIFHLFLKIYNIREETDECTSLILENLKSFFFLLPSDFFKNFCFDCLKNKNFSSCLLNILDFADICVNETNFPCEESLNLINGVTLILKEKETQDLKQISENDLEICSICVKIIADFCSNVEESSQDINEKNEKNDETDNETEKNITKEDLRERQDLLVKKECIDLLKRIVKEASESKEFNSKLPTDFVTNCIRGLANMCYENQSIQEKMVVEGVLDLTMKHIKYDDVDKNPFKREVSVFLINNLTKNNFKNQSYLYQNREKQGYETAKSIVNKVE